jgi:hypothetical protein
VRSGEIGYTAAPETIQIGVARMCKALQINTDFKKSEQFEKIAL